MKNLKSDIVSGPNNCFSKDTIVTVKKNNIIGKKEISEIKIDDNILTLINGEKNLQKLSLLNYVNLNLSFINLNV